MSLQLEIESVLAQRGRFERLHWPDLVEHFQELAGVGWRALYVYRVDGNEFWAVDIFRGDWEPRDTAVQMARARDLAPGLRPAFLVPDDESHDIILDLCIQHGIDIIANLSGVYQFLPLGDLPAPAEHARVVECRLPPVLVRHIASAETIDEYFGDALREFATSYLASISTQDWNDSAEEQLLLERLRILLSVDERFEAPHESLRTLKFVESYYSPQNRRDHYFHAFHAFLLGCRVIDQCGAEFAEDAAQLVGVSQLCCTYVWMLTALFHDVGYLQESGDLERLAYGAALPGSPDDPETDTLALQQRLQHWDGPDYRQARTQLVSLWEHLTQRDPRPPWHPDAQVPHGLSQRPFDQALYEAYVSGSHGVASCLRFLTDFQRLLRHEENALRRQFWQWHIYLAALSMPFHDRAFRSRLYAIGVRELSTRRFPFASLLAFIDSIQDDRRHLRGEAAGPDLLQDIVVEDSRVIAQIDWENLTEAQVDQILRKRDEIADVAGFLVPDGLEFVYPTALTGQPAAPAEG